MLLLRLPVGWRLLGRASMSPCAAAGSALCLLPRRVRFLLPPNRRARARSRHSRFFQPGPCSSDAFDDSFLALPIAAASRLPGRCAFATCRPPRHLLPSLLCSCRAYWLCPCVQVRRGATARSRASHTQSRGSAGAHCSCRWQSELLMPVPVFPAAPLHPPFL